MKTHEYFAGINGPEKYVLGDLSENDITHFEEHLLLCDTCSEDVRTLKETRDLLEESLRIPDIDTSIPNPGGNDNVRNIGIYLKIAAGIAILTALSWFAIWYFNRKDQSEQLATGKKDLKSIENKIPLKEDAIPAKKLIAQSTNSENYQPLKRFESQINEVYRSESITDVVPLNDANFKTTDIIKFRWKKQLTGKLTLTIYSNKDKIISQEELENASFSKKIQTPGLYYWQLETEEDIIYTGKFIILQPNSNTK